MQVFDPAAGTLRVLDSGPARYSRSSWRKDAGDLAYLKSQSDASHDGLAYAVHAWTSLGTPSERHRELAATSGSGADRRISAFRRPSWAEHGGWLFVGVSDWPRKSSRADTPTDEERAAVDVWHAKDVDVMPKQKVNARRDSERTLLAAWNIEAPSLTVLAHDDTEQLTPLAQDGTAYAVSWTSSALERSWGRFGGATLSIVDAATGRRTQVVDHLDDRFVRASPGGHYILYYLDGQFSIVDVAAKTVRNLTHSMPASFVDVESDETDVTRPWFGIAGWTTGDKDVLLYDKYDVWQVPTDGSRPTRLTDGAAGDIRFRYAELDPDAQAIDRTRPIYLRMFGLHSKKSGFARLAPDAASPERLLWMDKDVARLGKAKSADVFDYVVQSFDDSPDLLVGGGTLKDARQVTTTNPFQSRYAWGRSELIDTRANAARGSRACSIPRGLRARPHVSDDCGNAGTRGCRTRCINVAPVGSDYYNVTAFQSAEYFVLEPDIVFRSPRTGTVRRRMRPARSRRRRCARRGRSEACRHHRALMGRVRHRLPGDAHERVRGGGRRRADYRSRQQLRKPPLGPRDCRDRPHRDRAAAHAGASTRTPNAYVRNSAVFGAATMTTPLLIEVGDADGTVFWHQGVELYNVARRAKKDVVLLVYANEDHGLRQKADQIDYRRRILEWFGHYLRGEPAAPWILEGVRT